MGTPCEFWVDRKTIIGGKHLDGDPDHIPLSIFQATTQQEFIQLVREYLTSDQGVIARNWITDDFAGEQQDIEESEADYGYVFEDGKVKGYMSGTRIYLPHEE